MPPPARSIGADSWSRRGSAAVDAGDLESAKQCFKRAAQLDRSNASRRFHLALVLEALHEFGEAAQELTEALRLDPNMTDATRRLAVLCSRRVLPENLQLNALGLKAALGHDAVARDIIAEVALRHLLCQEPLCRALEVGRSKGWLIAARGLCFKRTGQLLRDGLFLDILRTSVIRSPDFERLLTSLRRVLLLEMPLERFSDPDLVLFAIALMQQCWVNEYVWAVSPEEACVTGDQPIALGELLDGNMRSGVQFLLASLYQPLSKILGRNVDPRRLASIRPKPLSDVTARHVAQQMDEEVHLARLPRLGAPADDTSRQVAHHYKAHPYPRWTRLGMNLRPTEFRRDLAQYFHPDKLTFMDRPFEVLIAGCGTGMHAIQTALLYGPNAHVLGLDLSAPSLAYAWRMADHFAVANVEFMQADIQQLGSLPDFLSRFRVIECGGVLHHLADPFQGWRSLIPCLAPGGLMMIGLYSARARRNLTALRSDPAYPGPGCDDAQLRSFRQLLMARPDGEPGSELESTPDFYTASGFRDLVLHVSERCLSIPEIKSFLEDNGLVFRGFHPSLLFDFLRQHFADVTWPGSLQSWAELEEALPNLFASMYKLWCEKA